MIRILLLLAFLATSYNLSAQTDSLFIRKNANTTTPKVSQDALYNRPFITLGRTNTAVGGYLEGNTNYFVEDGAPEGFSMEFRRFNIFLYSTIAKKIKFFSELEFEHGTEEISLETAILDFEIHPLLNLRTGIIVAPIGAFNQNHDSPKWEFVERPLVATEIIPSTLSDVGFGLHGKWYSQKIVMSYDAYLVNGLRDEIILNDQGRTFLQAGKNPEMFAEDNNGVPMFTGKYSVRHRKIGELGFSYYGGAYNTFKIERIKVDKKRNISIYAIDFNTKIGRVNINSEFAFDKIDVPNTASQNFGSKQWGGYAEAVCPVIKGKILTFENATLNLNVRLEAIDYNKGGKFIESNQEIGDEVKAIVPGISLRFSPNTVIRANYRYHWITDVFGNPPVRKAGFQFGFASYF
jgi:hypothetical protein